MTATDRTTGEETTGPALELELGKKKLLCPNSNGAPNWPTTAFYPASYILYVPLVETCADYNWKPRIIAEMAAVEMIFTLPRCSARTAMANSAGIEAINLATSKVL